MHPFHDMEIFAAVAEHGSLSSAARHLGLAPSVVADRLANLERRLSVRLITRTTRRQSLTEAGQLYLAESGPILSALASLEARVSDTALSPRGTLSVTASVPFGRRWVAPFIGFFATRYPHIRVHLSLDDRLADIAGEGFDIAIRGGQAIDSEFTGRALITSPRVVVAHPDYIARRGRPETPDDLKHHDCLVFNRGGNFHADWRFGRGAAARTLRVDGILASTQSELPAVWAAAGLGVTQKSYWEVSDLIANGTLIRLLESDAPDPITFYAIHPVSRSRSRKIALFIDELIFYLKSHSPSPLS